MKQVRYNLILCYNIHAYSVFDEYTRHRLLFAIHISFTLSKVFKKAAIANNWSIYERPSP